MQNLVLSKTSSAEELKQYFTAVLELSKSDNQFPINLDDVWPLVYERRDKAFNTLRRNFYEGEDYQLHQMGKVVTFKELQNGVKADCFISISCLEYFIARKVRSVFEVYRRVFHKVAEHQTPKELTPSELILQLAQINVENERKMKLLESKQEQLEQKVEQIMERTSTDLEFSSIMGFASRTKIFVDLRQASKLGIEASKVCKQREISMGKLRDPRFGYVKTYPDSVLEEVFNKFYPHRFRQVREMQTFA